MVKQVSKVFYIWHIWVVAVGSRDLQCWTEGRSSTAVAEDLRPTATATVAEVLGHIYGRRFYWKFS